MAPQEDPDLVRAFNEFNEHAPYPPTHPKGQHGLDFLGMKVRLDPTMPPDEIRFENPAGPRAEVEACRVAKPPSERGFYSIGFIPDTVVFARQLGIMLDAVPTVQATDATFENETRPHK